MRKLAKAYLLAWMVLLLSPERSLAGDSNETILVIANKAVAVTQISRDDLRPIFQTKKNSWPDGSAAKPFNLPDADTIRHGFDAAVLGLDPDRVTRYWIDRKIRGGDRPPQIAPSGAVMVKVVGKTPGGVGYVEGSTPLDASVKVIAKITGGQVIKP